MTDESTPLQVLRSFPAHDGTLQGLLQSRAARDPQREAVVYEGRSWSWQELVDTSLALAGQLKGRGIGPGDCVAVLGSNSVWHVLLLCALARIGAVLVPVNPDFKPAEAAHVLRTVSARAIICEPRLNALAAEAAELAGLTPWIAALGPSLLDGATDRIDASVPSDPDAVCVVVFTSGSTGFPKAATHSQRNVVLAGEGFVERMHLQPDDRLMVVLPMFHINALFYSVAGALAAGATLLIEPRFSASRFWQRIEELGATEVNIIEAMGTILLNRPAHEYRPGHRLRKVYGSRQAIAQRWRERFGVEHMIGGYAMTEIPGILSTPYGRPNPEGSMGMLCRHPDPDVAWAKCRIVDEADRDLPDGEVGELLIQTPIVMKGYLGDLEATQAAFTDGWFRTGDLVRRDAEGAYYFVSRKKDVIRRRGENVAGAELDRVVGEHPAIEAVAAIGVPSEFGDEDILVVATRREGMPVSEADIVGWCATRLAPTKVPRFVTFVETMPLTPTHKIAKAALRAQAEALRQRSVDFTAGR